MHYALHHRLVLQEFLRYVFSEQPLNIFAWDFFERRYKELVSGLVQVAPPYVQRKWQNISRHATMSNEGGVQLASEQQFSRALKRTEPESSGEEVIATPHRRL